MEGRPQRSIAVFGRDTELARIDAFLAAPPPAALVIEGEPGIGKSTLAAWTGGEAIARGWTVLRAMPTERERSLGFATLADLVGSVSDHHVRALPETQRLALSAALLRGTPTDRVDPRIVGTATASLLDHVGRSAPLLIVLDGLDAMDAASERAISFALRRLPPGARVVVTRRATTDRGLPLGLGQALPDDDISVLRPGPLTTGAIHQLLRARDGWTPSRPLLTRIADVSAGNPLYALELGRALRQHSSGRSSGSLPVSPTLRSLVARRLESLSPAAADLVLAIALSGRTTPAAVAAALPDLAIDHALDEAETAEVVEASVHGLWIRHPLLAAAIVDGATLMRRTTMHRRIAAVATNAETRAHHLASGVLEVDPEAASAVAEGAARALARGAPGEAIELFEAAIRLTPADDASRARRMALAAEASLRGGDPESARRLATQVLDGDRAPAGAGDREPSRDASDADEADPRTTACLVLADLGWIDGSIDVARRAVEDRLALERTPDGRLLLQSRLVAFDAALRPADAAVAARQAIAEAPTTADPRTLGYLLINGAFAHALAGLGLPDGWLARGTRLETTLAPATLTAAPLVIYQALDDDVAARERFALEDAWYRDRGEEAWRAERRTQLALVELRAGHWREARALVDEACSVIDTLGGPNLFASAYAFRALIHAHGGESERAVADLLPLIDAQDAAGRGWWTALLLSALVMARFTMRDHRSALDAGREMRSRLVPSGIADLLGDRSEPLLVESHLEVGDPNGAAVELARLERRDEALPRAWTRVAVGRCRALLLDAAGDTAAGLVALDATDSAALAAAPFEAAWSTLTRGRLLRRLGRRTEAASALDAAVETFRAHGATPWVARATEERRRIGLSRRPADELTASERRIADLAATGLTNREIATAVSLGEKTVEVNLTRVYAKIGIRGRAQLGGRLAAIDAQT